MAENNKGHSQNINETRYLNSPLGPQNSLPRLYTCTSWWRPHEVPLSKSQKGSGSSKPPSTVRPDNLFVGVYLNDRNAHFTTASEREVLAPRRAVPNDHRIPLLASTHLPLLRARDGRSTPPLGLQSKLPVRFFVLIHALRDIGPFGEIFEKECGCSTEWSGRTLKEDQWPSLKLLLLNTSKADITHSMRSPNESLPDFVYHEDQLAVYRTYVKSRAGVFESIGELKCSGSPLGAGAEFNEEGGCKLTQASVGSTTWIKRTARRKHGTGENCAASNRESFPFRQYPIVRQSRIVTPPIYSALPMSNSMLLSWPLLEVTGQGVNEKFEVSDDGVLSELELEHRVALTDSWLAYDPTITGFIPPSSPSRVACISCLAPCYLCCTHWTKQGKEQKYDLATPTRLLAPLVARICMALVSAHVLYAGPGHSLPDDCRSAPSMQLVPYQDSHSHLMRYMSPPDCVHGYTACSSTLAIATRFMASANPDAPNLYTRIVDKPQVFEIRRWAQEGAYVHVTGCDPRPGQG
ncbi:hypothetical protein BJY52DRAFT_1420048 [Lactarius psammicola]|nr:hypothetical protein BJY52DRAFT_1420048 [Lactarius psammicola]